MGELKQKKLNRGTIMWKIITETTIISGSLVAILIFLGKSLMKHLLLKEIEGLYYFNLVNCEFEMRMITSLNAKSKTVPLLGQFKVR